MFLQEKLVERKLNQIIHIISLVIDGEEVNYNNT